MAGLFDNRLVIVTGKGGVGKSTIAAAIALASARAGHRTLVCEVNTEERITALLGKPEVGPELGRLEENLWAVDIRPDDAMREYALMTLKFQSVYRAVFENRLVRYFLRFIPSLQELVMLGKILFHVRERTAAGDAFRFDRVVVDAPATGHAITFFSVPRVLVDTVPAGPLAAEAERMRNQLEDKGTAGVVLVSLPEELPVNETIELERALRQRVSLATRMVILNAFIPTRFSEADEAAVAGLPSLGGLIAGRRARERLSTEAYRKLETHTGLPIHTVPRLFVDRFSAACIEQIAAQLRPALEGRP